MIKKLSLLTILWFSVFSVNAEKPAALVIDGITYVHRWSEGNQHEFTPQNQNDLEHWENMLTINVFPEVDDGSGLSLIANNVLSLYQKAGKVLRTDSKPRTEKSEAEHLVVAILRGNGVMEGVHARVKMVQGKGTISVWSHREYGDETGKKIGLWLQENGQSRENIFMAWDDFPTLP